MSEKILSIQNLTKQHQAEQLSGISNVSFDINKGEIVAIIGESGSGKSTLLKSINGLLKVDEGEIIFNGKRVKGPDEQLIPGHVEMKMVTQDFSLNIYAKVYDNIASQLSNTNVALKQQKTMEVMEHLRIKALKDKKIIALSGGEQQRVAIAKALVSDTKVLLLDEPFSQVDAILKNQLRADIKRLAKETGLTIIMVSHDATDGLFMADRLVILKDGQLVQEGKPREVYNQPSNTYTAKMLGNAVVLSKKEAQQLGLKVNGEHICFYPEWVELKASWSAKKFNVRDIYYKGFYDELLLERNGVHIRALQLNSGEHKKNDQVYVNIGRFLEL
ncbi:ABC transporter ATP-binding protein [Pedobacter sp. SL55]|uniref:ABC transporter ATP-binding protein n=1 Tax=Pedobacter sp. SL55 TaxID=2995161 RepID=UPI00226F46DE|nr:ABC transporter ATP-binding protein [Pedobacter sp. SL55]WAC38980.1 ABC transporter ATP-binding protein [Pedobacter sp. SL55]